MMLSSRVIGMRWEAFGVERSDGIISNMWLSFPCLAMWIKTTETVAV
jgi:hypothetical protein